MIAVTTSPDQTGRSLTARSRRWIDEFRPSDGTRLLSGSKKIYRNQCGCRSGARRQIRYPARLLPMSGVWQARRRRTGDVYSAIANARDRARMLPQRRRFRLPILCHGAAASS